MKTLRVHSFSLFLVSASLLSLEFALMRVLKIEGFGEFTYSAIALALTGFGASGTLISAFRKRMKGKEMVLSFWAVVLFIFSLGFGFFLSKEIPFDPLRMVWDKTQIFRLMFRYLLYTIPFISGSAFIVFAFTALKASKAYFYNLLGSGFGVTALVASLYLLPPNRIFLVPMLLAFFGFVLFCFCLVPSLTQILVSLTLVFAGYALFLRGSINVLPYKELEIALNFPDARIVEKEYTPFGTIEVVESTNIRTAPGLSLRFEGTLPQQLGLFLDGDSLSVIDRITDERSLDYLLFQTQSAVYRLYNNPEVNLIGLGGGVAVERAFRNHAQKIVAVEDNPHLAPLLQSRFRSYNRDFFNQENISITTNDARSFLEQSQKSWDIIEISPTDVSVSSIGGIYSTRTDYLFTYEAFLNYLRHIKQKGTVSITLKLMNPPRNLLKVVALARKAMNELGIEPLRCVALLRSWSTGTLLMKRTPFGPEEIKEIVSFCKEMNFDLVYYPGITSDEVNRFNVVDDALYHNGVMRLLKGDKEFTKEFIKHYLFNISPPTDNKPYFSHFIRLKKVFLLFREMQTRWLFVLEGGYLVLLGTFLTTMVLSFLLILFPLFFTKRGVRGKGRARTLFYFSLIAISYMFIEIVLMERNNRYLSNPIYSNSVILVAMLVFSGMGSLCSDLFSKNKKFNVLYAVTFIALYLLLYLSFSDSLFNLMVKYPPLLKLLFSVMTISPLAFFMGIPFPSAIALVKEKDDFSLPWAWSVNGYFSVVASSGVLLLSTNSGLLITGCVALFTYAASLFFFPE